MRKCMMIAFVALFLPVAYAQTTAVTATFGKTRRPTTASNNVVTLPAADSRIQVGDIVFEPNRFINVGGAVLDAMDTVTAVSGTSVTLSRNAIRTNTSATLYFGSAPTITVTCTSPCTGGSGLVATGKVYALGIDASDWEVMSGTTALAASTTYSWAYHAGCSGAPLPSSPPTLVGSSYAVSTANTVTINFPTGSAAGNVAVLFVGSAWVVTTPSGWTALANITSTQWQGAAFTKVLTSADITAGSVTVTLNGAYSNTAAMATFSNSSGTGYTSYLQGSYASPQSLATDSSPTSDYYVLFFGSGRGITSMASSYGTTLVSQPESTDSAEVMSGQIPTANGVQTTSFTYSGTIYQFDDVVVVRGK